MTIRESKLIQNQMLTFEPQSSLLKYITAFVLNISNICFICVSNEKLLELF